MKGKKANMIGEEMYIHEAVIEEDQNRRQRQKEAQDVAKIEAFRKFAQSKFDFRAK